MTTDIDYVRQNSYCLTCGRMMEHHQGECMGHRGPWMRRLNGGRFYWLNPAPEEFDTFEVAHALARKPRYAGHTWQFYGVGEHSMIVRDILAALGARPRVQLMGLLHDAAEAYLEDWPKPLKDGTPIGAEYRRIEDRVLDRYFDTLGLVPGVQEWDLVKRADAIALHWETEAIVRLTQWERIHWQTAKKFEPIPDKVRLVLPFAPGREDFDGIRTDFMEAFDALRSME